LQQSGWEILNFVFSTGVLVLYKNNEAFFAETVTLTNYFKLRDFLYDQ